MALPYVIHPQAPPAQRVVHPTARDAARVLAHQPRGTVMREAPGSSRDAYLDDLITKPWGHEMRVYDDLLTDVWLLKLESGCRTSLHAHPRKDTCLICVDGEGALITGADERIGLTPGSVVHIHAGALHRSVAETCLTLVEVETPRDKFDLVRIEDSYGRTGTRYEDPLKSQPQPCPLVEQLGGPPRARLRQHSITGEFRFNLESGAHARRRPDELVAAIILPVNRARGDAVRVLSRQALTARGNGELHLTIRSTLIGEHRMSRSHTVSLNGPGFQDHDVIHGNYRLKEVHSSKERCR